MTSRSALGTAPSGWPVIPAAASPGASASAAPSNCRFFKDLLLQPVPGGRGYRLDLASTELLALGLQLERELDRCARYRQRPVREQVLPAEALGRIPTGGCRQHHRRRAGTGGLRAHAPADRPSACWNICAANTSAWRSIPLAWVSHHWQQAVAVFADLERFPQRQVFGCGTCPTIWSATRMPRSSTFHSRFRHADSGAASPRRPPCSPCLPPA